MNIRDVSRSVSILTRLPKTPVKFLSSGDGYTNAEADFHRDFFAELFGRVQGGEPMVLAREAKAAGAEKITTPKC